MRNRLGLKYWAGCTEDHVGKYFEGLENYPDTRSVRTFSRKELSDIIDQAGEFKTTFYYPYPDYKFPMTIYSDKRLPKKGELGIISVILTVTEYNCSMRGKYTIPSLMQDFFRNFPIHSW